MKIKKFIAIVNERKKTKITYDAWEYDVDGYTYTIINVFYNGLDVMKMYKPLRSSYNNAETFLSDLRENL